jgi:hypothetical protein
LRVVDVLPEGPASQAGAQLFGLGNIVAFNPQDPVVLYVQLKGASAAAVKGGRGANDFDTVLTRAAVGLGHIFLRFSI